MHQVTSNDLTPDQAHPHVLPVNWHTSFSGGNSGEAPILIVKMRKGQVSYNVLSTDR